MGVPLELRKKRLQERRPIDPSVIGPEHAAQCLMSKPGAAALVGNRPAPAADAVMQSLALGPADAARADDDDTAVMSTMRADAGRLRVGGHDRFAKRMRK